MADSCKIAGEVVTQEMHTGGEPLRIIEKGLPIIEGATILDKIRFMREHLDSYRKFLMREPRGHQDMYGTVLVSPDLPTADLGAIFMHNEGYSTMCGHATIALGRYVIDKGIVKNPTSPETRVRLQCPCGLVDVFVEYNDGKTGSVRFSSVPSFLFAKDVTVNVPDYGEVKVDIVFGGAFYALVPASAYGLKLGESKVEAIRKAAGDTTDILRKQLKLEHPDSSDLAFLYGTIITDGQDEYSDKTTDNVCVFAERQIDRSPCGSGVTSRITQQYMRGLIKLNQTRTFRSISGATFTAKPIKEVEFGDKKAVIVEVSGKGHYSGTATFSLEPDDDIGKGFLLE